MRRSGGMAAGAAILALAAFAVAASLAACDGEEKAVDGPEASAGGASGAFVPGSRLVCRVLDYPPQYFKTAGGAWTGLDVEIMRAVAEEAGLEPAFVEMPWARALDELRTGSLHLMANLSATEERSAYLRWVGPERTTRTVLVTGARYATEPIGDLDDLVALSIREGLVFGIQTGAFYSDEFSERMKDPVFARHFEEVTGTVSNQKKAESGRIIGFFEDYDTVMYRKRTDPDYAGLEAHPFTLASDAVFIGVSKAGVPLDTFDALAAAFVRLETSGKLDAIRVKRW